MMTSRQIWLTRRFVVYKLFTQMWFVGAVWLYFYRIFITDQQVGVLDGMAFAIGLIAEIPSGALADKFGRDRLVRLGQILAGSGLLIQAAGSSFAPFFVGQAIFMIGVSFVSGADEALFFEELNFKRKSTDWRKLLTRTAQITLVGSLIAYTTGAYLHTINPRLPWVLNGFAFIISAFLIWSVKDSRPRTARKDFKTDLTDYVTDIREGLKQFTLPKLSVYVPIILAVQGLFYTAGWGLLRLVLLSRFGFSPFVGAIVISACSLGTVGLLAYIHKHAENLSEKKMITTISVAAMLSLLLSTAQIGYWGFFILFALYAGEHILYPFMSEVLNNHAPDSQRATVLSVGSTLRMLPYIFLAPLIGALNTAGNLEYFLVGWSVFIGFAILIYRSNKKSDKQIQFKEEV